MARTDKKAGSGIHQGIKYALNADKKPSKAEKDKGTDVTAFLGFRIPLFGRIRRNRGLAGRRSRGRRSFPGDVAVYHPQRSFDVKMDMAATPVALQIT